MTHRDRVIKMLNGETVDRPVVQYLYTPVGFYEHGERLNGLYEQYPGDFGPFKRQPIPVLPPEAFDSGNRYYEVKTDEWGVTQEYRVYGIMGHAIGFPIKTPGDSAAYVFPPQPDYITSPELLKEQVNNHKKDYFALYGGTFGLMQKMWHLRGFENFMMDLYEDTPEMNSFIDRFADYECKRVEAMVEAGADAIAYGDDYGTQDGLILSKEMFRYAIKPRLKRILEPAANRGLYIHFHSCGRVIDLFDDFKDIGVTSIWPQLPVYKLEELADAIKYYDFSLAIHTDRAFTMTHGSPADVKETVLLENETFKPKEGKSWFFIETDTGFPFENIRTLVETVFSL